MFWLILLVALSLAAVTAVVSSVALDGYGRPEIRERVSANR